MIISKRIQRLEISPIRKLNPYAAAAKASGKKVYHLNIGQPDIATPPNFLQAIRECDHKIIAYGDSRGDAALIRAIQNYYSEWGMDYDGSSGEITITNGGSEATLIAIMALCDAGDEILVFEPFYANYSSLGSIFNVSVRGVPTTAESGYMTPSEQIIESYVTPKTRAILLSNPGNPTGRVLAPDEMERIANVAVRHDLALISDEVYREFVYGFPYRSFGTMPNLRDRVVIIDSVSKRYSACGARIGALLSHNAEFNAQVMKYCCARLCCPELDQIGAAALYSTPKEYLKDVNDEYRRRRDTLEREIAKIPGVICSNPQGAFYVMIKMPVDDAEKFAIWLLKNFESNGETVMFAPGNGFYSRPEMGKDEARLAYVLNCADLTRAIEILAEGLRAYPGTKILA